MNSQGSYSKFGSGSGSGSGSVSVGGTSSGKSTINRVFGFLLSLISLIFIGLIIYVVVMGIFYFIDPCVNKKDFWEYLSDFTFKACYGNETTKLESDLDFVDREVLRKKEVFHIDNQIYNYKQAEAKCKAYGARLATKNEVIDAYNQGANWCSYGWSANGEAYYPIQKKFWMRLPKNERMNCGFPGINGGEFEPTVRFGANCFGIKPPGRVVQPKNPWDEPEVPFCKRPENKLACSKNKEDDILPFNPIEWSEYN